MLDHQAGLFQTVKDISVAELRTNTIMLAKLRYAFENSSHHNSLRTERAERPAYAGNPSIRTACSIRPYRKGEVNAWDNEDFVNAVRATGKKTLIMAGVWTSVCVMFPALDAKAAGFKVYAVIDASGDPSEMASLNNRRPLHSGRCDPDFDKCGAI